jgi:rubredoxin
MHDEILKRLEARLDRRSFLRGSGLAAAALVGVAAASPLIVFAEPQDRQHDDKKKDDPDKKDPKKDTSEDDQRDQPDQPSDERGSTTETKLDASGNEFRECPQCGHNMYRQGRTWTCENCGYSYIE